MECLINFLSDDAQRSLINMVQNRDETFEFELDSYRKLFMVEMDYCIGRGNERYCSHDGCRHKDSCVKIHDILHDISANKINRFFEGVRQCYLYWIDSKTTLALEAFDSLLKEYGLISEGGTVDDEKDELLLKDIENRVFFRARITDEFLSKQEMFHVPYNKRYNIRNERFSLTGQPVLYLGNSIADVVEELGIDVNSPDSLDRLRVSSFEFIRKYTKKDEIKKRIFDLRCNITNDLFHVTAPSYSEKKFFRNILSQICSFQKRKELEEYAFKEEYVIPQMFAQILKQNNYDGICYYSTKRFHGYQIDGKGTSIADIDQEMQYRENLALFTHMSGDGGSEPYDSQLYEGLEISMPVAVKNIKLCSENDLWKVKETISRHNESVQRNDSKVVQQIEEMGESEQKTAGYRGIRMRVAMTCENKARTIVDFYNKIFSRVRVNGKGYSDTKLGQAHIKLLIGILNRLLVESELVEGRLREKEKDEEKKEENNLCLQLCNILGGENRGGK